MEYPGDGRFDERLLRVVAAAGVGLLVLFLVTPVLRPYYAILMPIGIFVAAGAALWLLRSARVEDEARRARLTEPASADSEYA